ncbi:MAG: nicotinate phosphoribosyltransferase [Microthrixaceae bacterium]|nr:nicotinate phosphoribosyltransferase [Microthrixaceae bacterium]
MVSAMYTDHYELTMIEAALADGTASKRSVFEAYFRRPPNQHVDLNGVELPSFGVMAGADRIVETVAEFGFTSKQLVYLKSRGFLSAATLEWLGNYRFTGDLLVTQDGERIDAEVPVVTVRGSFAEAIILETVILSILNSDATIATRAMQFRHVAGPDAVLIEMGSRRTHEEHAVAAAHAAIIGGFNATSNLEAGFRFGVPTAGTAAHAWTLAHTGPVGEIKSFRSQMKALGTDTTLLVDTYEIETGVRRAVQAAQDLGVTGPGAIRIDSGDLAIESVRARELLDSLGAHGTRIVASGDLDIPSIDRLHRSRAPIDAYGIGTRLVAAPPLGFIYKLVAIEGDDHEMVPVAKRSGTPAKATRGGDKTVVIDSTGAKVIGIGTDVRTTAITNGQRQPAHPIATGQGATS